MPDGKPNPNCPECKGIGRITLLTWSCKCDCVNRKPIIDMKILDKFHIDMKLFEKYPYYINKEYKI